MKPFKRIICPTDFSEPAKVALDAATMLVNKFDAELHLVHVVPPVPIASVHAPSPAFDVEGYYRELVNSAKDRLKKLVDTALPDKLEPRQTVVQGDPASEIVRIAHDEDADLIVMSTHGESGFRRFVFGSVAQKTIQLAERPVLAVPIKDQHE